MKVTVVALFFIVSVSAKAQTFESGEARVPLIELYTSEGCSSCPPADRWLSSLIDNSDLWSKFVPLAFHVDYWDYIGWKDPYASQEYSQRQRRYAAEYNESTVYTPGVRKNGKEWRSWRTLDEPVMLSAETIGKIEFTINDGGHFYAQYKPANFLVQPSQLNVAVLGLEFSNVVTRGENRGKTLEHDFVVLSISTFSSSEQDRWQGQLFAPTLKAQKYAVAVWLTEGNSLTPLQATGGYLTATLMESPG